MKFRFKNGSPLSLFLEMNFEKPIFSEFLLRQMKLRIIKTSYFQL